LKTSYIVNPNAGCRRAARLWPEIRRTIQGRAGDWDALPTRAPGHASALAEQAASDGAGRLVCVGGDGTLNEVVNGLMRSPEGIREGLLLGYIPCGTGCDFARSLGLPANPLEAAALAAAGGESRMIDVGRLAFHGSDGRRVHAHFLNVASFGLGGEVDERVNRGSKAMGGFLSFIAATLISLVLYRAKEIRLRVDGGPALTCRALNVAVANGQYHGGGMWVARDARLDDGLFNIVVIGDLTLPQVFRHLPKLYDGRLNSVPRVRVTRGSRVEAWSPDRVLLDVDGEQPGRLPLVAEIIPRAVRIVTA